MNTGHMMADPKPTRGPALVVAAGGVSLTDRCVSPAQSQPRAETTTRMVNGRFGRARLAALGEHGSFVSPSSAADVVFKAFSTLLLALRVAPFFPQEVRREEQQKGKGNRDLIDNHEQHHRV
jgi:hypothetical protein